MPILNQGMDENDRRKYFMIKSPRKSVAKTWRGLNPQPPDHQSDAYPTEPLRPASGSVDPDQTLHAVASGLSPSVNLDQGVMQYLILVYTVCSSLSVPILKVIMAANRARLFKASLA